MSVNSARVLDCFTFFNEFDLLEIRLRYLYDSVDYFIIVESDTAFNGTKKPYNFQKEKARFQEFEEKIVYVPYEMPALKASKKVAWEREALQRNAILEGLEKVHANVEDIVLMGDVDEIPKVEVLQNLRNQNFASIVAENRLALLFKLLGRVVLLLPDLLKGKKEELLRIRQLIRAIRFKASVPVLLRMDNFYYFLNNREKKRNIWKGTLWIPITNLPQYSLNDLRELRRFPLRSIYGSGWHFSYLGGKALIKHKIRSFSHQEFNIEEIVNDAYIEFCMKNGFSLFDYYRDKRIPPQFQLISMEEFPKSMQELLEKYPHLIHS